MQELFRSTFTFHSTSFNTTESKAYFINAGCFGDDVALWIGERLKERGAKTQPPGQEDFGWYLRFDFGGAPHDVVIGFRPDDCWIGWIERACGFWGSLVGGRHRKLSPKAAVEIHNILSTFPQITDLRWHYKSDFDRGDEKGAGTPIS